ncbi:MAG: alpha/beta fold hydrolase, partial [Jiangellales bacterium]
MRRGALALVGLLLVAVGLGIVLRADNGLVRERALVDAIPVEVVRPAGEGPFPAVVVAHGFSGSSRLMDGIGIALARAGWVAAMPDLSGHGGNLAGLDSAVLADEVLAVADWLAGRPDVTDRALLGHSMGAGASLDYATRDSGIDAVVLISGGWRLDGPYRPPNALFLY